MTTPELIAALRAATGPDRTLDAEIAALLRIVPGIRPEDYLVPLSYRAREDRTGWVGVFAIRPDGTERMIHSREAPAFTGSIDAALTLVPIGYGWSGGILGPNAKFAVQQFSITRDKMPTIGKHAIPAIALCIAALEAMG